MSNQSKRALFIWSDGVEKREDADKDDGAANTDSQMSNSKKKTASKQAARNSATSFSQAQWSSTVENYFDKYTSKLTDDKFNEIMAYAEDYLPERSKQSTQDYSAKEDELVMSD
ncbi:hypothetical protein VKT23_017897 [Stygiomarasmius scandens]|uniref:Uncharacterized protein n=1 Tax=Marasmiellus scandens TaxID=2682957 RepID=A0ABR1IR07_9AGAR